MKKRNVRTLSLIIVTFTYLLIGAAVFDALEGPNNDRAFEALTEVKQNMMDKYNLTEADYRVLEVLMIEKKPHKSGPQWKFSGSFYYALVVLTLIGYGHSTPATTLGKAFTMGYAMAGIPMAMVMFQSMGERMNKFYSVIINKVRQWQGSHRTEATEFDLIVASGITSSIVTIMGALMYHTQEGWSLFDSMYYTFITLSTIGFGDFVALQRHHSLQFHPYYVCCSFIFLLLGLACFASSVNLLVLRFMILSLEEDEQEDLVDQANILTLDGELMVATGALDPNGGGRRLFLPNQEMAATSERNLFAAANKADTTSVCSCTCYGRVGQSGQPVNATLGNVNLASETNRTNGFRGPTWRRSTARALGFVGRIFGCKENLQEFDDENFYDEETQSISNYARYAIKRASF
ncbi:two pore potassium channel protein sup-9-like [Tigriopus californicus]|uniref:two pore potassium channel protein sup-9-like n=1 Tax=Tigriopus californicus TaxID=6832 RepID=UPI0027D9F906|nr:two pore potassium channel protein sup-9-like [Tigriopus californicus]XP_059099721.1 two pore potassium channel protein sup-9-like [Tigriopus californicus]